MDWKKHGARLRSLLSKPWLVAVLAVVAVLRVLPALSNGLFKDDHFHRAMVAQDSPLSWGEPRAWSLFETFPNDALWRGANIESGWLPWWTQEGFYQEFWRPLASLTHTLDYTLWPQHPGAMHLHSILWFAVLIWCAWLLYRRLMEPAWVGALAFALYAFDDLHSYPVGWLANRSALMAAAFGILALLAHDAWRRRGWKPGALWGPVAFGLGLASGEIALGAVASNHSFGSMGFAF